MTFVDQQVAWQLGVGVVELDWAVVLVSGEERLSWLSRLSSQILVGLDQYYFGANGWPVSGEQKEQTNYENTDWEENKNGSRLNSVPSTAETDTAPTDTPVGANMTSGGASTFSLGRQSGPQFVPLSADQWEKSWPGKQKIYPGVEGLILDPQGHVTFPFSALDQGDKTFLLVAKEVAAPLTDYLKRMRFLTPVEIEYQPEAWSIWGWRGASRFTPPECTPATVSKILGLDIPIWVDPWPGVTPGGTAYSGSVYSSADSEGSIPVTETNLARWDQQHPGTDWGMSLLVLPAEQAEKKISRLLKYWQENLSWPLTDDDGYQCGQARKINYSDWQALRIAALRPQAQDLDQRSLPHELDWLRTAVHLHKGCYCGQETVARIVNLGRPPRQICRLDIDGSGNQLPIRGAEIQVGGRSIGTVLAAAQHYEQGPIGLGMVRRIKERQLEVQLVWEDPTKAGASVGENEDWNSQQMLATTKISVPARLSLVLNPEGKAWDSPSKRPGAEIVSRETMRKNRS